MNGLFKIFKLTVDQAKEIAASPDKPHIHNFEELIVGMEGKSEHFIDFKSTL